MSKGISEKITIDGKEIVVKDNPELLTLIESVRKSEKDKLYSQISGHESKIKVLEDEKKKEGELTAAKEAELKKAKEELEAAKAEAKTKEEELKAIKAAKKGTGDDDDDDDTNDNKGKGKKNVKNEGLTLEQIKQLLKEEREEMKKEFEEKLGSVSGKLTKSQVDQYRKEQLAKYKDVIVDDLADDLVPETLDSQEAVNKAIEKAIAKSKKFIQKEYEVDGTKKQLTLAEIEQLEKEAEEKKKTPTYNPDGGGKPPAKPEGGSGNLSGKELLSKLGEMSDEEYEKHRDQIMREAKQEKYQGAQQ